MTTLILLLRYYGIKNTNSCFISTFFRTLSQKNWGIFFCLFRLQMIQLVQKNGLEIIWILFKNIPKPYFPFFYNLEINAMGNNERILSNRYYDLNTVTL